jgi:aspartate-semialdehyde dehydrogenase
LAETKNIALVGSETLLGREIRDIVATTAPDLTLRLIAAQGEEAGILTRVGDEPTLVGGLDAASLSGARAVILAGPAESSRKALKLEGDPPDAAIIDLTFQAEERSDARLRAPSVESETDDAESAVHVIAHPAAIALALFLRRLQAGDPIRGSVIQIFAPASEHGAKGVEELQQQTISLLSFKSLPQAVFDSQLSFNMLARYGEEAPAPLENTELLIERHLATLLDLPGDGEAPPMPSLRLIQAPVFHGYSFSAWVEFEDTPDVQMIESHLAMDQIEVRGDDTGPPTNVSQAGQGGVAVGAILPDRNNADACWFWLVADNLRLAAENAVAVARQLV